MSAPTSFKTALCSRQNLICCSYSRKGGIKRVPRRKRGSLLSNIVEELWRSTSVKRLWHPYFRNNNKLIGRAMIVTMYKGGYGGEPLMPIQLSLTYMHWCGRGLRGKRTPLCNPFAYHDDDYPTNNLTNVTEIGPTQGTDCKPINRHFITDANIPTH